MMSPRNVSASIRQRLLNRARSNRRPFNELLQYFAMERFLYRLSQSTHAHRYVLKGALMLYVHTYILMADRVLHGEPCSELDPRGTALGASGRRFHGTAAVTADPARPSRQTQSGQHKTPISFHLGHTDAPGVLYIYTYICVYV